MPKSVRRLNLFVKGNVDVRDSLHSSRVGGQLVWNGINEVLRVTHPHCSARVKHETWGRSDALLRADGVVPEALTSRNLPMGSYPAPSQFSKALFDTDADVFVFSIQPDITNSVYRHKKEGYLLYPNDKERWTPEDRQWLRSDFENLGELTIEDSMNNLSLIIEKIRARRDVPILIYNLSPIAPGETVHCYQGLSDAYTTRIRRFNVALIDLSEQTGISIIDIDSLLARKGADQIKLDMVHVTPDGQRLIAEEVVRVLADLNALEEENN